MGRTGTGTDLTSEQTETLLIEKTYLTVTDLETHDYNLNLLNMQQHVCGIFQCSSQMYNPITDVIPYALIFNDTNVVTKWCCTAEYNDKGIYHVHCMLKTPSRPDSVRRSIMSAVEKLRLTPMFINKYGAELSLECIKLQKAHKPSGMLQYMMKNPIWTASNDDAYLRSLSDIVEHGQHERFRQPEPPENEPPKMNPMAQQITDVIIAHQCRTIEDTLKAAPQIMAQYLHKPGFSSIITNCLMFVKETAKFYALEQFDQYDPNPETLHQILLHQAINPSEFDEAFYKWVTKSEPKKNTICLHGPSNTGKSAFIQGLKQVLPWGEIINSNNFAFEGLAHGYIGIWEEPLCSQELAEKAKQVLEGMECMVPVKFKKPIKLPRVPIIITTNHDIWRFCNSEEDAFRNRMYIFRWEFEVKDTNYTPRTSNDRCQCCYCQASCGRQTTTSSTSPSRMQISNEPISTGEQPTRSIQDPNVGTGSMPDPGEGTSRSFISCSSTNEQTNCSRSGISSSSTIECFFRPRSTDRSNRPINTGDRVHNTISGSTKLLVSKLNRGYNEQNLGRNDADRHEPNLGRGNGSSTTQHTSTTSSTRIMGTTRTNNPKLQIPIQTKKRKMGHKMGPRLKEPKLNLFVPTAENWKEYISYVLHRYAE